MLSFLLRIASIENCRFLMLFCIISFLCDLGLIFDAAPWIPLFLESSDETFDPLLAGPKCIIFLELCCSSTGNVASFPVVGLAGVAVGSAAGVAAGTAVVAAACVAVRFVSDAAAGACDGC